MAKKGAEEPGMQIDAPNRDFPRRCEKQGGTAQSVEHIVHIDEGKPPTTAGGGNLVGGFLSGNTACREPDQ